MTTRAETILKYVPMVLLVVGIASTASVAQYQIGQNERPMVKIAAGVDENAEDIDQIERDLIQRQGEIELDLQSIQNKQSQQGTNLQRIEKEQTEQGEALDDILNILRSIERSN